MLQSKYRSSKSNRSKFNDLPSDIYKLLLLYFDYCRLYDFFRISKKFYRLSNDESFWVSYADKKSYSNDG